MDPLSKNTFAIDLARIPRPELIYIDEKVTAKKHLDKLFEDTRKSLELESHLQAIARLLSELRGYETDKLEKRIEDFLSHYEDFSRPTLRINVQEGYYMIHTFGSERGEPYTGSDMLPPEKIKEVLSRLLEAGVIS